MDQKLLDVSTQEVLTAKALSAREKDMAASRTRRLSFGRGTPKALSETTENSKPKSSSISRRESYDSMTKKSHPRSNASTLAAAYGLDADMQCQSSDESTRISHIQDNQHGSEGPGAPSHHGFFEKVIDTFSAISTPSRVSPNTSS